MVRSYLSLALRHSEITLLLKVSTLFDVIAGDSNEKKCEVKGGLLLLIKSLLIEIIEIC